MYAEGHGVAKDEAEAVRWFRKAAAQNHPFAQNGLGVMYRDGRGVTQDVAEAVRWFRKAAAQGHELAKQSLSFARQAAERAGDKGASAPADAANGPTSRNP